MPACGAFIESQHHVTSRTGWLGCCTGLAAKIPLEPGKTFAWCAGQLVTGDGRLPSTCVHIVSVIAFTISFGYGCMACILEMPFADKNFKAREAAIKPLPKLRVVL
jgi:hypothetical protein